MEGFIWDAYQQGQISKVRGEARSADRKAEAAQSEMAQMASQVDRLTIACQAMWEIIRDNTGVTEAMLRAKIEEVDLRDGKADGKITRTVMNCPKCGAKTNSKRRHCVMCGEEVQGPHVFEG